MSSHVDSRVPPSSTTRRLREGEPLSRNTKLALVSFLVIAGFFILREHWNHVLGLGPYLLLLLCPLMHLFGHGHHHHHGEDERRA